MSVLRSIVGREDIFSPVIGILGSFTIKMERRPRSARISVVPKTAIIVQSAVFPRSFVLLNWNTAVETPKKRSGRSVYLPNLTENSLKEATTEAIAGLFAGRIKAAPSPRAIAIKYLIQSFIMNKIILKKSALCHI